MAIHVLDKETIDKIAAGEVVERPSSVVKELVENAIDAGASAVTVEAKDGGIEYIRVTDNGCGIPAEELRTAFLRHATSKLGTAGDLHRIGTLGFRGEALSSIAAVSRLEIITKTADALTGTRMTMDGGDEQSFAEVGAPEGTTILIRNLFYNTPARRKFLKTPATEGSYIADLMERIAISHPEIAFQVTLNGKTRFHTSGKDDLQEVIYRVYGRDIAGSLVPIAVTDAGIGIRGFLGKPELVRSNRGMEIYFLNGRYIRSDLIARAIEEGYREYLMLHKFPLCILRFDIDAAKVDVNVHPTKMDVRISDQNLFFSVLSEQIHDALKRREMIPGNVLVTERERKASAKEAAREVQTGKNPEPFAVRSDQTRYGSKTTAASDFRGFAMDFDSDRFEEKNKGYFPGTNQGDGGKGDFDKNITNDMGGNDVGVTNHSNSEASVAKTNDIETGIIKTDSIQKDPVPTDRTGADRTGANRAETDHAGASHADEDRIKTSVIQSNLFDERILTRDHRARFRLVGQVFETFWIIQYERKMMLIDQHAAHEKVNYERMMKRVREKSVVSQSLLPPIVVSLSGREESVLLEHLEAFRNLGYEIEPFGGSEYSLRAVPVDLYGHSERELFLAVLGELADGNSRGSYKAIEEKVASMSCKASVKGGDRLTAAEAEALIDELLTCENPYNCPHGRPTIIAMTETELEKKFKRIVD